MSDEELRTITTRHPSSGTSGPKPVESEDTGHLVQGRRGTAIRVSPNALGDVAICTQGSPSPGGPCCAELSTEQVVELIQALITQRTRATNVIEDSVMRGVPMP